MAKKRNQPHAQQLVQLSRDPSVSCESVRDNSGSAQVWAASEMRSRFPWASHVLPLLVFALAALAVGKLDQFADLMENWLSKL